MLRNRAILFYPLVLATFPAVFLYAQNVDESISPAEFMTPLAALLLLTTLLLVLLRLAIKDNAKVSVIVSILLLALFSYGAIHDIMWHRQVSIAGVFIGRHRYLLGPTVVIALAAASAALLYQGNLAPLMRVAAAATLVLILFNVGRIVDAAVSGPAQARESAQFTNSPTTLPAGAQNLPDIYYIILDGYGRDDVLMAEYGFDNREFIESLRQKGFIIPPEARTNYIDTGLSLFSSLLMRHLYPSDQSYQGLKDTPVLRFVKSLGYQYVHLDSGYGFTRRNPFADIEYLGRNPLELLLNDYSAALVEATFLPPLVQAAGLNIYSPFAANKADRFNANMQILGTIPDIAGLTFTFNHNVQPHPPYIFDRDGNTPPGFEYDLTGQDNWNDPQYIDQLIYVSKRIEEAVDKVLEGSATEPIIIIQGDHGPAPSLPPSGEFDNPSDALVIERTGILNAFYLPEYCRSSLYPTITPVNTFKLVFNECLGGEFVLTEDSTYWRIGEPPIDFSRISP